MNIILEMGSMRSGTTWLMSLLDRSPFIKVFFEPFHCKQMSDNLPLDFVNITEHLDSVYENPWVCRSNIKKLPKSIIEVYLLKLIVPTRFPHNCYDYVSLIQHKKIFIIRSPFEVINSRLRIQVGARNHKVEDLIEEWIVDQRFIMNLYDGNSHLIHYPKLCSNTNLELKKIFDFIGLPSVHIVDSLLHDDLDHYSVNKNFDIVRNRWKFELSLKDISVIESRIKETEFSELL